MKTYNYLISLWSIMAMLCASCDRTPVIEVEKDNRHDQLAEHLLEANRYIASSEQTQIDGYVARRGWSMETLSCGARFSEYQKGAGSKIEYEDSVTIIYSVEALNGTKIYNERKETLVVGRHQTVTGIDAVLLELHRGSRSHIILPSEAAYGVVGDGDRIPTRTVLVYDLYVKN